MANLVKNYFTQDAAQSKFKELLGNRASSFATSVLQVVASNQLLSNATRKVYSMPLVWQQLWICLSMQI